MYTHPGTPGGREVRGLDPGHGSERPRRGRRPRSDVDGLSHWKRVSRRTDGWCSGTNFGREGSCEERTPKRRRVKYVSEGGERVRGFIVPKDSKDRVRRGSVDRESLR